VSSPGPGPREERPTLPGRSIRFERGGDPEGPGFLLLHGLGATSEVWRGLAGQIERQGGWWAAPDLAGHGRSDPAPRYSYGGHAADAAAVAVEAGLGPGRPVTVVGHSMGGVIGLLLAGGGFGIDVRRAVGLGIKVAWTAGELERMRELAVRPPRWFDARDEAEAFFLKVSGLAGLAEPGGVLAASGVREEEGRFRLAADPATSDVGAPPMERLVAAAGDRGVLARGEHDALVSLADLRRLDPEAVDLPGLGHNAHVEDPAAVWELVSGLV
jgi:pimeloyl-ACP methyl ester carboxylesterase